MASTDATKEQPTDDDLQAAWTEAIHCEGIIGAHSEALIHLRELRDMRSTWFGEKSNGLRVALDRYLNFYS